MRSIWEEIGVTPVLNAQGNRTLLGGNTPAGAVRAAMDEAEEYYVDMGELIDKTSERIAELLGVEAALVTSGCAAALAVGAAGFMTGTDPQRIEQIPDVTGMPYEFIIQRQLRVKYDRCVTLPGGRLVEVGGVDETRPEHVEEAIGPNTAGIHYLAPGDRPGALPLEQVVEIGHAHGIPIIVDAAGQVYPLENLSRYVKMGADLVCYGAKYFGAVNSSGVLTGKREYVEAARLNSFIGFESTPLRNFARTMKLDRQEVVAVYAALREWLTMNHEDRFAGYEVRIATLRRGLRGIRGVELVDDPAGGPAEGLRVRIDPRRAGKTAAQVIEQLHGGTPSIWVREVPNDRDSFILRVATLKEGGESVIIERLREIL